MSTVHRPFPYRSSHTHLCLFDYSVRACCLMLVSGDRKLRRQTKERATVLNPALRNPARRKVLATRTSPSRRLAFVRHRTPYARWPLETLYPRIVYHAYLTVPVSPIGKHVPYRFVVRTRRDSVSWVRSTVRERNRCWRYRSSLLLNRKLMKPRTCMSTGSILRASCPPCRDVFPTLTS